MDTARRRLHRSNSGRTVRVHASPGSVQSMLYMGFELGPPEMAATTNWRQLGASDAPERRPYRSSLPTHRRLRTLLSYDR